jgi:hypothetical protein
MNGEVIKEWFIQLLKNLEQLTVIVMDNAPYHSILIDKYSKSNWRKSDNYNNGQMKKISSSIYCKYYLNFGKKLKTYCHAKKKYELDDIAIEMGHEVIHLSSYHYKYNPIELIWAQVRAK